MTPNDPAVETLACEEPNEAWHLFFFVVHTVEEVVQIKCDDGDDVTSLHKIHLWDVLTSLYSVEGWFIDTVSAPSLQWRGQRSRHKRVRSHFSPAGSCCRLIELHENVQYDFSKLLLHVLAASLSVGRLTHIRKCNDLRATVGGNTLLISVASRIPKECLTGRY